jgi:hypothetical protein
MKTFALAVLAALSLGLNPLFAADYSVTTANVLPSSAAKRNVSFTAAASIAAGDAVYLTTSNTWALADANLSAAASKVAGIAENSASTGQIVSVVISDEAFAPGFTVAANAVVVLSATAGKLCPVADLAQNSYLGIVGIGVGSNKIRLLFARSEVPTP